MDEASRFKAEPTALFAVRVVSNCLLVMSFDAAFGMLFDLPPILICISSLEMLIYLALAMLLRRRFKSLIAFGLVHLAGIFLVTFGAPYMFYVHLIEASWISVLALLDYNTGRRMLYPGIGHIVWPFFIFIAGFTTERQHLTALAIVAETFFFILFMLRRNFESLDNVFVTSSRYVRVPYGKMRRMNFYLAVFFMLASLALAVILGLLFDGEELVSLLGRGMIFVIAGFFVAIVWLFSHILPNVDDKLVESMAGGYRLEEILEEHPFLLILWRMFEVIVYALTILVFCYLAYRLFRGLYYEFRAAVPENGDKRVFLETREENDTAGEDKRTKKPGFGPADRVRRKYIRLVRESGRQNELSESMTPREIEEKIMRKDLSALHDAYEKARYG